MLLVWYSLVWFWVVFVWYVNELRKNKQVNRIQLGSYIYFYTTYVHARKYTLISISD